jgi:hypothetical protein
LGQEIMAVELLASQGDEQVAFLYQAGVGASAPHGLRGRPLNEFAVAGLSYEVKRAWLHEIKD